MVSEVVESGERLAERQEIQMNKSTKPTTALAIIPKPKVLDVGATGDLSEEEQVLLKACEARVEQGLKSFTDTALALWEINAKRLYRPKTWVEYLKHRWHMSRSHGNRFIDAAAIIQYVEKMAPKGDIPRLPQNERAYRMLLALTREGKEPRDAQIKVLKAAAEGTQDAPDISPADILQAAVKVEIATQPVDKGKQRLRKWNRLKAQFEGVLKDIEDEGIVERLQSILTAFTGLIEPKNSSKKADDVTGAEERGTKGKTRTIKSNAK